MVVIFIVNFCTKQCMHTHNEKKFLENGMKNIFVLVQKFWRYKNRFSHNMCFKWLFWGLPVCMDFKHFYQNKFIFNSIFYKLFELPLNIHTHTYTSVHTHIYMHTFISILILYKFLFSSFYFSQSFSFPFSSFFHKFQVFNTIWQANIRNYFKYCICYFYDIVCSLLIILLRPYVTTYLSFFHISILIYLILITPK